MKEVLTTEQQQMKNEMNSEFAKSVLMFAMIDIKKNGARRPEDYMTPMRTAIVALDNGFTMDELADMMSKLAHAAKGLVGKAEIAA